ncbi:hypothetical protein [Pseudomonas viridiflava]|nr:hypothetical protein [Pseudomonas viridiflava]
MAYLKFEQALRRGWVMLVALKLFRLSVVHWLRMVLLKCVVLPL